MPRLTEQERDEVNTDFDGHFAQLLVTHPNFEIEPGFGLVELRALGQSYRDKRAAIESIEATGMPFKRAQRDALFGLTPDAADGIWLYLGIYKSQVRLKLPKGSPLATTVPNIGKVAPNSYDAILRRFGEHWALVNAALPAATPLTIGPITLAELESRRAQIAALEAEVDETVLTRLAVLRAEREQLFGDVREADREPTSLVARFEMYRNKVLGDFAGTPLAQTVPRIFPTETALSKFAFNYRQSAGDVVVWFDLPVAVPNASVIYLKEGAFEETTAIPSGVALKVTFSGVAIQGEVDEVELRDSDGFTVARGDYNPNLVEPM